MPTLRKRKPDSKAEPAEACFFVLGDLSILLELLNLLRILLAGLMLAEVIASPVGGAVCLW